MMNRRSMLKYSMATVALTLTGCKKANTTVVVVNQTGAILRIKAKADKYHFNKTVRTSAKQKYAVKGAPVGEEIPFIFTSVDVKVGKKWVALDLAALGVTLADLAGLTVQVGVTNTFTITADGVTRTPELPEEEPEVPQI